MSIAHLTRLHYKNKSYSTVTKNLMKNLTAVMFGKDTRD